VMMRIVPDFILVFATNAHALHEARNQDIPLIGLVDTNTNPAPFLYPVYANDDSIESVSLLLDVMRRGIEEGRKREHEAFAILMMKKIKQKLAQAVFDPSASTLSTSLPSINEGMLPNSLLDAKEYSLSDLPFTQEMLALEKEMEQLAEKQGKTMHKI